MLKKIKKKIIYEKKIKDENEHKKTLATILSEHKKITSILVIVIYILILTLFFYFRYKKSDNTLELLNYLSQIICSLCIISATIIALLQYSSECNDRREEKLHQKKIEASKLANEFKDKVIPKINLLASIYRNANLYDKVVDLLNDKNLIKFNNNEIKIIFPNDLDFNYRIYLGLAYYEIDKKNKKTDLHNDTSEDKLKIAQIYYDKFYNLCIDVGNSLEYFSICFNSGIANSKVVYQSLHEVFFAAVNMIYISIFENNINEYNRKFSNVSNLYIKWRKVYGDKKKEEERIDELTKKNTEEMLDYYKKNIAVKPN